MEMVTDSLSEGGSPATTTRSPEDEDLLQRSTKKTKRGRNTTVQPVSTPRDGADQVTPLSAGIMSPEAVQWKTPVETPNSAWNRKVSFDTAELEAVSEEESMEEDKSDPNCPIIPVTKEEKERLRRPWRKTLIVKVLGRKVNYHYLRQRLQRMWKPEANFDLIAIDQDYFLARFEERRDYEFAKFEGPWIIVGHYLTVQEWEPNFFPHKNKLNKLLVWVRFPTLPIEYFEDEFLMKIGKNIGRPVKVDTTTSLVSIGKFARVCVELDVTRPLLSKFTLGGEVVPVEYEGIQLVCFKCGIYGHKQGQCGVGQQNEGEDVTTADSVQDKVDRVARKEGQPVVHQVRQQTRDFSSNFGEWMLVARRDRKGPQKGGFRSPGQAAFEQQQNRTSNMGTQRLTTNSRFAILEGLEEGGEGDRNNDMQMTNYQNGDNTNLPSLGADRIPYVPLPKIRTNQRSQQTRMQVPDQQRTMVRQNVDSGRGGFRGRGGRGNPPKRAAAESEHTVVRGSNKGKQIVTTVVRHTNDEPGTSNLNVFDYALVGDPPDVPNVFAGNLGEQFDAQMDDVGQLDPGDDRRRGGQCS